MGVLGCAAWTRTTLPSQWILCRVADRGRCEGDCLGSAPGSSSFVIPNVETSIRSSRSTTPCEAEVSWHGCSPSPVALAKAQARVARHLRLAPVEPAALAGFAPGTFGHAYAEYIDKLGLDPAAIPSMPADTDLGYVEAHLADAHDYWHVVTGFGVDLDGEIALQAFSCAQLPSRFSGLLALGGVLSALFFARDAVRARWAEALRGWRLGKRARPLFGIDWPAMLEIPLVDVRRAVGIDLEDLHARRES